MGDTYLSEFKNVGDKMANRKVKPERPVSQRPIHEGTEHDYLHVYLSEKIGEYRTNIVIYTPSTDQYHGVSGYGRTADGSREDAFNEAGKLHGTFTYVTFKEYLDLPKETRHAIEDEWATFREQVIKEADTINYIVYTREIPKAYFCPAVVTQSLMHAKFVAEDMRSAGYKDVVLVETPQLTPGLTAPKLKDPTVKFKRISDAMTPEERKMYEGLPTEDSTIVKQESVRPKGDERYITEAEKKRLDEQPAPDIKAKHPGILGVKPGEFMKKKSAYFVSLAEKKGRAATQKALLNLEQWNKNDDPPISKRARVHIEAIKKAFGD